MNGIKFQGYLLCKYQKKDADHNTDREVKNDNLFDPRR